MIGLSNDFLLQNIQYKTHSTKHTAQNVQRKTYNTKCTVQKIIKISSDILTVNYIKFLK